MKTFSEACLATFMRKHEPGCETIAEAVEKIDSERWEQLHEEIQNSTEVGLLTRTLWQMQNEMELPMEAVVAMAFSHGVVVGIAMEQADIKLPGEPNGNAN